MGNTQQQIMDIQIQLIYLMGTINDLNDVIHNDVILEQQAQIEIIN